MSRKTRRLQPRPFRVLGQRPGTSRTTKRPSPEIAEIAFGPRVARLNLNPDAPPREPRITHPLIRPPQQDGTESS